MKILIVSAFPTHPTTAGNIQWMLSQAKLLIQLGHEVYYLWAEVNEMVFVTKKSIDASLNFWGDRLYVKKTTKKERIKSFINEKKRDHSSHPNLWKCDEIYPESLTNYVISLNSEHNFDACIVHYFYLTKLFDKLNVSIKVLSTHDSFAYRNLRVNDNSLFLNANEEAKAMQRSTHILALQESEKNYFEHLSPLSKSITVYNYYPFHNNAVIGNKNILFLSSSNPYNINGINWFIEKVLPLLHNDYPECKLIIGGSICSELSKHKENKNIELQGNIDNIEDFYSQGDVAINPVSQGTGLKIKTFEAISFDKATIVHPHSLEGIYKKEKAPLFFSDQAAEWQHFFHQIWNNTETLINLKERNCSYIEDMNQYIIGQYSSIFN